MILKEMTFGHIAPRLLQSLFFPPLPGDFYLNMATPTMDVLTKVSIEGMLTFYGPVSTRTVAPL